MPRLSSETAAFSQNLNCNLRWEKYKNCTAPRIQNLHCSKKRKSMITHQSSDLAPFPCPQHELHLLPKQALLFLATLWVLGETSAPSVNPSCSVFPVLLMHAWEGNTSLCNTLHSCWVLRQGAMCQQGYVLQREKIHKNEWSFIGHILCVCVCVCGAAMKVLSSSLNFQSLC